MRNLVLLVVAAALLVVLLQLRGNRGAIERARADAARLASERDSLLAAVEQREHQQAALVLERDSVTGLARALRDSVTALERRRAAAQLTVRQIRTTGALVNTLRSTFPELGRGGWGLTTVPLDQPDTIGIEYLMVPAWFAETFVIDHGNAESWRKQKDRLLAVDSLRLVVAALQDSMLALESANAHAYQTGYQAAYASYQDLSERHIAELKKPRIRLGSALGVLGGAGVGVILGRAIP
jgi:hypothetical protein